MDKNNNNEYDPDEIQEVIDDMLSPSDQVLIDLAGGLLRNLCTVKNILADRNSIEVTSCFVVGLINTLARTLTNINIDVIELKHFLNNQLEEHGPLIDLDED